jgi:hypothetical protein
MPEEMGDLSAQVLAPATIVADPSRSWFSCQEGFGGNRNREVPSRWPFIWGRKKSGTFWQFLATFQPALIAERHSQEGLGTHSTGSCATTKARRSVGLDRSDDNADRAGHAV